MQACVPCVNMLQPYAAQHVNLADARARVPGLGCCSALQGLLRKLGAGFEDLMAMSMMSGGRFKVWCCMGLISKSSQHCVYVMLVTGMSHVDVWPLGCHKGLCLPATTS